MGPPGNGVGEMRVGGRALGIERPFVGIYEACIKHSTLVTVVEVTLHSHGQEPRWRDLTEASNLDWLLGGKAWLMELDPSLKRGALSEILPVKLLTEWVFLVFSRK